LSLPLLISVPHAGLSVPEEVRAINILSRQQIIEDGDEGAQELYNIGNEVLQHVSAETARAFVDLNRPEFDRGRDGVVKTHTCWDVPIYGQSLTDQVVETLLSRYYRPYHARLSQPAQGVKLGIDCHTMAAIGPPIGPLAGEERPAVCISDAGGTCPRDWVELMLDCFRSEFSGPVTVNFPFKGGYIIKSHSPELPWLQLEISRAAFAPWAEKQARLLRALGRWCHATS
jgi:N-formylglutamate deformylase